MNARKLATALRLAAEALEDEDDGVVVPRRQGKRAVYVPPGPIDEVTAARAQHALSKMGMVPK